MQENADRRLNAKHPLDLWSLELFCDSIRQVSVILALHLFLPIVSSKNQSLDPDKQDRELKKKKEKDTNPHHHRTPAKAWVGVTRVFWGCLQRALLSWLALLLCFKVLMGFSDTSDQQTREMALLFMGEQERATFNPH